MRISQNATSYFKFIIAINQIFGTWIFIYRLQKNIEIMNFKYIFYTELLFSAKYVFNAFPIFFLSLRRYYLHLYLIFIKKECLKNWCLKDSEFLKKSSVTLNYRTSYKQLFSISRQKKSARNRPFQKIFSNSSLCFVSSLMV